MKLHLIRMSLRREELVVFARNHDLLAPRDDDFGYVLHAWLRAMFGSAAPQPFYFDMRKAVLYGYSEAPGDILAEHAAAFADPMAHRVLEGETLAGKPMPERWTVGRRLELHVRACPVTRKDDEEKDVFLRALDRWEGQGAVEEEKPRRADVYCSWFRRQIDPKVLRLESLSLMGMRSRGALLRRARGSRPSGLRVVERPEAHFRAVATVRKEEGLTEILARGVGRHRAFGFGMIRLLPAK
ncbi:MAG TPA: type I-E CRISPR-associated protein Cas6/Cse3/CasE [Syntrophales bacterium]|nr:type I-E CRISPR-associated protein Cas6/Cse3/CasE [Syntrophales bacterium]HPC02038.1 type I-E CRISPR-associated protein Cas6/Cse3/CasE [Syntrophales bacterium]HRS87969.1 type I-E CRISPR-associated protein Cas6/Cse3/CasE [Syntrophales bacterium]